MLARIPFHVVVSTGFSTEFVGNRDKDRYTVGPNKRGNPIFVKTLGKRFAGNNRVARARLDVNRPSRQLETQFYRNSRFQAVTGAGRSKVTRSKVLAQYSSYNALITVTNYSIDGRLHLCNFVIPSFTFVLDGRRITSR